MSHETIQAQNNMKNDLKKRFKEFLKLTGLVAVHISDIEMVDAGSVPQNSIHRV